MKWTPGAMIGTLVAGGNGSGNGTNQLNWPHGLYLDPITSAIWIADTNNHRIVRWSSPSISVVICGGSYGSAANQFIYPQSIFVDASASNTLYVADTGNDRIQKWLSGATSGTTVAGQTLYPGSGLNQLDTPNAVIVDNNGNIYISDGNNNRIMRWTPGANSGVKIAGRNTAGQFPDSLNFPRGLRFGPNGALVISDYYNNRVQMFTSSCCE